MSPANEYNQWQDGVGGEGEEGVGLSQRADQSEHWSALTRRKPPVGLQGISTPHLRPDATLLYL